MIDIKVFLSDKLLHQTSLSKDRILIGRSETSDIVLADKLVSRLHTEIVEEKGTYYLRDHSRNGTFIDDSRVDERSPLPGDCRLKIHPFTLHCIARLDENTLPLVDPLKKQEEVFSRVSGGESPKSHFGLLIGEDPKMLKIYQTIERVAESPASVLIRGESGTGKELVAKSIHQLSKRRNSAFVALDCAAIPDNLIESELFGYEKGAFTGAESSKKGWFEEAQGGTVFLDEIGELSQPAQAKLLRFLQDQTYTRLGGNRQLKGDVRLVTATNRNLEKAIESGVFRSDLYYRLRVVQIFLPPLRDRLTDIPLLVNHILSKIQKENNLNSLPHLTEAALSKLKTHPWPGNIRQLENALYNAFISSSPPHVIDVGVLDLPKTKTEDSSKITFQDTNRSLLLETLKNCHWDTAAAANALKVSRGTIYYKCKKLGINLKGIPG